MSIEGMADVMMQIVAKECPDTKQSTSKDFEKPALIGHSMGGYISLAMVDKNPGKFRSLGLFHSSSFADSDEKKKTRNKSIEFIRVNGSAAFIRQSTPNLFSNTFKIRSPEIIEALIEQYAVLDPLSLISYYEAMIKRPDRSFVLKGFAGPVLFFIGEKDPAVPLADSLRQCHLPQLSHIHIFENMAHMGMLENREQTNWVLEEFLGS